MTDCLCTLPGGSWAANCWHLRVRASGTVEAYERCPTVVQQRRGDITAARLERADVPRVYRSYTRESYRDWPDTASEYLADPERWMLLIHGPNGCGKSHLAVAILDELLQGGARGLYVSAKLLPELSPERSDADRDLEQRYRTVPVLVLDDLFSESNFRAERVRNLVEVRWRERLATIVTSMRGLGDALRIDSDLASRVASGRRIERGGVDQRMFPRAVSR